MRLNSKARATKAKASPATAAPEAEAPEAIAAPEAPATTAAPAAPEAVAPLTATAPAIVAEAPPAARLTEAHVAALFALLTATASVPVKIGKNRGRDSSEPLLAPHARVGVSARNIAAVIFAAAAQNITIAPGAIIPRFFTYADTPLHVETGAGRNILRGRTDKKSGATSYCVKLAQHESGDAFLVTDSFAADFALVPPANIKAFRTALASIA